MKSSMLKYRWFAMVALGAALAACGGYTTVTLGGAVSGLITSGLVLESLGATVAVPVDAKSYTFPAQIADDGKYAVTVKVQPPRLTCQVSGASGIATGISITTANVFCSVNRYALGGTINGLTAANLILTNGGDNLPVPAGSTTFTFGTTVQDGASYGVAVLQQPTNQTCVVTNGTKVMGSAPVTDVVVTCK